MEQAENNLIWIAGDSAVSKYTLTYCESPPSLSAESEN